MEVKSKVADVVPFESKRGSSLTNAANQALKLGGLVTEALLPWYKGTFSVLIQ